MLALAKDIVAQTKKCNTCGENKLLDAFWRDGRRSAIVNAYSRYGRCIECSNRYEILSDSDPRIVNGKRTCCSCKKEKPLYDFSKSRTVEFGRSVRCKQCLNEQRRGNERFRKSAYKLSAAAFKAMFDAQNGKCGICENKMDLLGRSTCVDHDHNTGEIREILCGKCNLGLGHFSDSIENMKKAIAYLEKHSDARIIETKLEIVK